MKKPVHPHYISTRKPDKVDESIRKVMDILTKYQKQIIDCKVQTETANDAQYENLVHMRIFLTLAGKLLESCDLGECATGVNTPVTSRSEYLALSRKLENKYRSILLNSAMPHEFPVIGEVTDIFATENYGRITTMSGRKSYFLRSSLLAGDFDKIKKGTIVEFNEEVSPFGTLANSVRIISTSSMIH